MVHYAYRCEECGPWDTAFPMGTAEAVLGCPTCGARSRRRWSAPSLSRMERNLVEHRQREEASRDVPDVAGSVPAAVRRRHPVDPRQAALPRP